MAIDRRNVQLIYNPQSDEARGLADELARMLGTGRPALSAEAVTQPLADPPSLVVTVGGDGTILRASHIAAPINVPLLGVNLGRLGFLTEVEAADALEMVPHYLEPDFAWVQERGMIHVQVQMGSGGPPSSTHALNDVVVGRGALARLPRIHVWVNGAGLATYSADAVIVATATGSTGYALSAGGPILYPTSRDLLLKAVAPHGDLAAAVVVPEESVVELAVEAPAGASLTVDGYWHLELPSQHQVRVEKSPHIARFLRAGSQERFYETLLYRLHRGPTAPQDLPVPASQEMSHLG